MLTNMALVTLRMPRPKELGPWPKATQLKFQDETTFRPSFLLLVGFPRGCSGKEWVKVSQGKGAKCKLGGTWSELSLKGCLTTKDKTVISQGMSLTDTYQIGALVS